MATQADLGRTLQAQPYQFYLHIASSDPLRLVILASERRNSNTESSDPNLRAEAFLGMRVDGRFIRAASREAAHAAVSSRKAVTLAVGQELKFLRGTVIQDEVSLRRNRRDSPERKLPSGQALV